MTTENQINENAKSQKEMFILDSKFEARRRAMDVAVRTNKSGVSEDLIKEAEAIYTWLTKDLN